MKKICVVTATRSEFGPLKWLIKDIGDCVDFELQLVVTGSHLSPEQGNTINQIKEEGFDITYVVDTEFDVSSTMKIAETMGKMCQGFAKAFEVLRPDYLLVLGDRYELLPICNAAFVMRIPIIHLSGGDITMGAIDDGVRNAITMMSEYHFPGTIDSLNNIVRMRGCKKNVWAVGEPGLDSFYREKLLSREDLARNLGLDVNKKWILMTFHPETLQSLEYNLSSVKVCLEVLLSHSEFQVLATYANADFGGKQINELLELYASEYNQQLIVIPSLGHLRYLSFMRQAYLVVGNSSSGIVEAPFLNIPVINIGDRQKGRYQCGNVVQCDSDYEMIYDSVLKIMNRNETLPKDLNYWGDGHTSERIISILKSTLV